MNPPGTATRRSILAAGVALTGGCLSLNSSTPTEDGYPTAYDTTPTEQPVDTDSFSTITVEGTPVPLAPIDVTYYWYRRRAARFADARGQTSFEAAHITGAAHSPALESSNSDPVRDWPQSDRIVCYCGCPHHLSSIRAAQLIDAGYQSVYVIDEGFWEWTDLGYPVSGSAVTEQPNQYVINGRTRAANAGQWVWVTHEPSGQHEAATIDRRGRYQVDIRFYDLTPASTLTLETPGYRLRASVAELTGALVTG